VDTQPGSDVRVTSVTTVTGFSYSSKYARVAVINGESLSRSSRLSRQTTPKEAYHAKKNAR
jgi:hypothetical protein